MVTLPNTGSPVAVFTAPADGVYEFQIVGGGGHDLSLAGGETLDLAAALYASGGVSAIQRRGSVILNTSDQIFYTGSGGSMAWSARSI